MSDLNRFITPEDHVMFLEFLNSAFEGSSSSEDVEQSVDQRLMRMSEIVAVSKEVLGSLHDNLCVQQHKSQDAAIVTTLLRLLGHVSGDLAAIKTAHETAHKTAHETAHKTAHKTAHETQPEWPSIQSAVASIITEHETSTVLTAQQGNQLNIMNIASLHKKQKHNIISGNVPPPCTPERGIVTT